MLNDARIVVDILSVVSGNDFTFKIIIMSERDRYKHVVIWSWTIYNFSGCTNKSSLRKAIHEQFQHQLSLSNSNFNVIDSEGIEMT